MSGTVSEFLDTLAPSFRKVSSFTKRARLLEEQQKKDLVAGFELAEAQLEEFIRAAFQMFPSEVIDEFVGAVTGSGGPTPRGPEEGVTADPRSSNTGVTFGN